MYKYYLIAMKGFSQEHDEILWREDESKQLSFMLYGHFNPAIVNLKQLKEFGNRHNITPISKEVADIIISQCEKPN